MNDVIQTMLVLGCVLLGAILIVDLVRLIHTLRLRINRERISDLEGRCMRLRLDNDILRTQVTSYACREYVHDHTIARLMSENDMLAKENDDFRNGTPVKEPIRVKRFRH